MIRGLIARRKPVQPLPAPPTFRLSIEPIPPYRAKLICPAGVEKLLSEHEAYQLLCERALGHLAKGRFNGE